MRFLFEKDSSSGYPTLRDDSGVLSVEERDQLYEYVSRQAEAFSLKASRCEDQLVDVGFLQLDFPLASLGPKPRFRVTVNKQGTDPRIPTIILETIGEKAPQSAVVGAKRSIGGKAPILGGTSGSTSGSDSVVSTMSASAPDTSVAVAKRLIAELTRLTEQSSELTNEQRAGVQYALRELETYAARQSELLVPLLFASFLACGERCLAGDPRRAGLFSLAAEGLAMALVSSQLVKDDRSRDSPPDETQRESADRLWRQLLRAPSR